MPACLHMQHVSVKACNFCTNKASELCICRALAVRQPAPAQLGQGLSRGLTGLAGSLAAGVSGVFAAPVAGEHAFAYLPAIAKCQLVSSKGISPFNKV